MTRFTGRTAAQQVQDERDAETAARHLDGEIREYDRIASLTVPELLEEMRACNVRWVYGPSTPATDSTFVLLCAEYDRRNQG